MKDRFTIKIAGAAGQGIKSSGIIISKAAKRSGYYTFGYTEYPSLIRGGHNVYQIEISDKPLGSITKDADVLLALNKESIDLHVDEFDIDGGVIIVDQVITIPKEQQELIDKYNIKVYSIPLLELATNAGGNALMKNTVTLGATWKTLGLPIEILQEVIAEVFNKTEDIITANKKAAQAGYDAIQDEFTQFVETFKPQEEVKDELVVTGNETLALGAVAAGVKLYSSYPMTPASSLLTNLAKWAPKAGILVKQAEDEITAANMCVGANFAGTRAMCGTSGGGLDLMSESISLAGITETPFVAVLAQRHGAATGAPTWTGQGDLNLAIHTSHGEFPRIVMSVSDSEDAFYLAGEAFNFAERFQVPVLLLTDKYIAESTYTIPEPDQSKVVIDRGKLIPEVELTGEELRYKLTEDGVSPRWFPGEHGESEESKVNSTYITNSDEHTEKGYSTEDEKIIKLQVEKRHKKIDAIKTALPDPTVSGDDNPDIIFLTWGSNKNILEDAARFLREDGKKVQIIHYSFIWPLKTKVLDALKGQEDKIYVVEQNIEGQFANLVESQTELKLKNRILRYDSKPFYLEDIIEVFKNE